MKETRPVKYKECIIFFGSVGEDSKVGASENLTGSGGTCRREKEEGRVEARNANNKRVRVGFGADRFRNALSP